LRANRSAEILPWFELRQHKWKNAGKMPALPIRKIVVDREEAAG
jgi:hypothetical protein